MTFEEAKQRLEWLYGNCANDEDDEAMYIAIKAISIQIPKKAKVFRSSHKDIYTCATCGSTYIRNFEIMMNFCSNCGQRQQID